MKAEVERRTTAIFGTFVVIIVVACADAGGRSALLPIDLLGRLGWTKSATTHRQTVMWGRKVVADVTRFVTFCTRYVAVNLVKIEKKKNI